MLFRYFKEAQIVNEERYEKYETLTKNFILINERYHTIQWRELRFQICSLNHTNVLLYETLSFTFPKYAAIQNKTFDFLPKDRRRKR